MAPKKETEEEGKEAKEGTEATNSASKKKKKMMIFAGAGVVLLLLLVGIPLLLMGGKSDQSEDETDIEEPVPEVIYKRAKLDTFIVNLSDPKRFLKTTLLIEYDPSLLPSEEGGKGGGHAGGGGGSGGEAKVDPTALPPQIKDKEPQVRDAIIQVLSSKRAEDLLTATGKQALKEELVEAINTALDFPDVAVVGVFFTEFIIQ